MAQASIVDYYAILNLPPDADLAGIENAYARISDELVALGEVDEACRDSLVQVNEAYSVLSKPELRRQYDNVFLAKEREAEESRWNAYARRRLWMQRMLIGALLLIVVAQAGALAYLAGDQLGDVLHAVLGPLMPGGAS